MTGGACNDCGAKVAGPAELKAHADQTHGGMGRYRYWDGKKETVTCALCGETIEPSVVGKILVVDTTGHQEAHVAAGDTGSVRELRAKYQEILAKTEARLKALEAKED